MNDFYKAGLLYLKNRDKFLIVCLEAMKRTEPTEFRIIY